MIEDTNGNAGRETGQDTSRQSADGELTMWTTMMIEWTVTATVAERVRSI